MNIVYSSFSGRFSDNPRAIYEALLDRDEGHRHVWLVDPEHAAGFPPGIETRRYGSPACVRALETADVVVANHGIEFPWEKSPDTTYVQTWHGTPLKRIHWDSLWTPAFRMEVLDRDVARWDLLLSPSPYASRVFRRAFRYTGHVLEVGAPRDDILLAPERAATRAVVRAAYDIPDDAVAVLYAPTWRDDEVYGSDGGPLDLHLDVEHFVAEAGEDHHLLMRLHYMQTGRMRPVDHPNVHDASFHPDVRDLHLAADVLVTDYSSLMFDFAVTGKPMAFLAYDLERYRDQVRGLCFDLTAQAPGPVVRTTEELLEVLSDPGALFGPADPAYAAFRDRYCPLEDGRASDRVVDWLLRLPAAQRPLGPPARDPVRR